MPNITLTTYCDETLQLIHGIEKSFLELGKRMMKIRDEQLWEGRFTSFAEFLEEAGMTEGTASKLIKVYQRFILEYNINPDTLAKISWTKLYTLLPLIKDKAEAQEKIENLGLMSRQDVENEIRDIKHPDCHHEWVSLEKCVNCHKTRKDYHG